MKLDWIPVVIWDYNGGGGFYRGESISGTVVVWGPRRSDTLNRGTVRETYTNKFVCLLGYIIGGA